MGLLISNKPSALNNTLCMPFEVLYLFTARSFILLSSQNVRAARQVFSSKEHNQGDNLEGMGVWTPTNFTQKENLGVMRAEQSKPQSNLLLQV